jgi:hypothetical protein
MCRAQTCIYFSTWLSLSFKCSKRLVRLSGGQTWVEGMWVEQQSYPALPSLRIPTPPLSPPSPIVNPHSLLHEQTMCLRPAIFPTASCGESLSNTLIQKTTMSCFVNEARLPSAHTHPLPPLTPRNTNATQHKTIHHISEHNIQCNTTLTWGPKVSGGPNCLGT